MIEAIMYCAIGFLAATLLALLTLPAVWRRAVRLTRRRIENALPVSLAEIQADKDEARAAFALAARQQEMQTERLQAEVAVHWTRIAAQTEELVSRQARIDALTAALADIEGRHATLTEHDRHVTDELAIRTRDLDETRAALASTRSDLAATRRTLEDTAGREEELKVEHVALTTLRDTLRDRITDLDRHLAAANAHLTSERERLRVTAENLATEVARGRTLTETLAATESERATLSAEAAALRTEVATLTLRVESLVQRTETAESRRAAAEADAARRVAAAESARATAEAQAREAQDLVTMLRAEKAMLDGALAKAREDRAMLDGKLRTLQSPGGAAAQDPGMAALRDQLSTLAAEMAVITAALEGPDSPINTLLAETPPGRKGAPLSLADRVRALQDRARRRPAAPATVSPAPAPAKETNGLDHPTRAAELPPGLEGARPREAQPTPSAAE